MVQAEVRLTRLEIAMKDGAACAERLDSQSERLDAQEAALLRVSSTAEEAIVKIFERLEALEDAAKATPVVAAVVSSVGVDDTRVRDLEEELAVLRAQVEDLHHQMRASARAPRSWWASLVTLHLNLAL